jgi:hypothetical protein
MTAAVQTRSNHDIIIASCRAYKARRVACAIPEEFLSLASILAMTIFQWIVPALCTVQPTLLARTDEVIG